MTGLLATIAVVALVGVSFAWWRSWRRRHRPVYREEPAYVPKDWSDKTLVLESATETDALFWKLFEGRGSAAAARREGGMFATDDGARISIYCYRDVVVVVVALQQYADWVQRFVASRTDGIVYRDESRHAHEGFINAHQARNINRHGLKTAPDQKVAALTAQLMDCTWMASL